VTTASDLILRAKIHLLGNTREEINVLVGDYTAGGGTLTFAYPMASITPGADLEIDTEVFRVMSVSGQTATVRGGQLGSTPAHHDSGSVVTVNPRFYAHSILTDLNNSLADLDGAGIYQEVSLNITFNPVVSGYDLTGAGTVLDILEVRYQQVGPTRRFPVIPHWSLMRDMDTSVFPSGTGLVIDSPGFPGLPLRVRYAAPLTQISAVTDTLDMIGLSYTAADLPPIGAAIRQMMGRDVKRSFLEAQPDTRRAQEVPPGVAQGAIRTLQGMYQAGIADERMRQLQRFPYRTAG
jgi:hypothetical protein